MVVEPKKHRPRREKTAAEKRREIVGEGRKLQCQYCPKKFKREYDAIRHEVTRACRPTEWKRQARSFQCDVCETRSARRDAAIRHGREIHDARCATKGCKIIEGPHPVGIEGAVSVGINKCSTDQDLLTCYRFNLASGSVLHREQDEHS